MTNYRRLRSLLFLGIAFALAACGGSSGGSSSPGNPPPFDKAKGEGVLVSGNTVVTYSTGGAGSGGGVPALNAFYQSTICPSGLTQPECTQNQTNLNTPQFGNFDLSKDPIGSNPLGITQVDALKVTYGALNVGGAPVTVSGGMLIPETDTLKGIILYFHGTVVQRSQVPSNFVTDTNPSGNNQGMLLGATWASQGYLVVMPDYIGLGDDTVNPHPYVVYDAENAQSGLAMVKAVTGSLTKRLPFYITGYSEGAAYALQAGHMMQDNPRYASSMKVKLMNVTPISGAFDLTGAQLPFLFANVQATGSPWFILSPVTTSLGKPFLSADLAVSFSHYSDVAALDIMPPNFYNCASGIVQFCGSDGTLSGMYYQTTMLDDTTITLLVSGQANRVGYGLSNAITPLLTPTYAQQLMNQDTSNPLYAALLAADTYLFTPKFPVALTSLQMDSVVTRVNSDNAYVHMFTENPKGPYQEILVDNNDFLTPGLFGAGPIDHTSELPFMAILALNQFNLNP